MTNIQLDVAEKHWNVVKDKLDSMFGNFSSFSSMPTKSIIVATLGSKTEVLQMPFAIMKLS